MQKPKSKFEKLIRDNRTRSALKAISYRLMSVTITFIISWIITGNYRIAFTIGGLDAISKIIFYYIHERAWHYSSIGRVKKTIDTKD